MTVAAELEDGMAAPVVFDRDGRHLFGWYHAPATPAPQAGMERDCVVVMVAPVGYDAVCTHRHYRALAMQLAQAGFPVLRYDHHGTGDSSGSEEDPQRIVAWTNGVARAAEFARRRSGAGRVCLFGVRLGATLALSAARLPGLADLVVAWAPFPSGKAFLREMRALGMRREADISAAPLAHDAGADVGEEAAGYVLTASTIAALGALDLLALPTPPTRDILLLERDDLPQGEKLARHLRQLGCDVRAEKAEGYAAMMRDPYESTLPRAAFDQVEAWLSERCPLEAPALPVPPWPGTGPVVLAGPGLNVQEQPVRFGRHLHLFGMLSRPREPQAERAQTAVLFVSVGSNLHTGPNRMYVTQARVLAALGFVALRMDIGGVGESPPAPGTAGNQVYAAHSITDVQDAVAYLRAEHRIDNTVLIGLCSGAYLSFHAAVADAGISSIVLINQQTFHWKEGDTLEVRSRKGIQSLGFYRSRLFRRETWLRVLRGEVHVRLIAAGVARVLHRRLGHQWAALVQRHRPAGAAGGGPAPVDVPAAFAGFLQRGTEVFLVFSAEDGGLDEIETHLGPGARRLQGHRHFKLQVIDGADHTFTPLWAQRRLSDLLAQHVMRLYG